MLIFFLFESSSSSNIYRELDFNEIMNAPLPPCPLDTTITTHWLAVEGVQPAIRQNPSPEGEIPLSFRRFLVASGSMLIIEILFLLCVKITEVERALGIATKKRKTSTIIEKPIEVWFPFAVSEIEKKKEEEEEE